MSKKTLFNPSKARLNATRPLLIAPNSEGEGIIYALIPLPNTEDYRQMLRGGLLILADWLNYKRSGTTREIEVANIWRGYIDAMIFGFPPIFRQNPLDNCQLQQSHDNGETWSLAFDYGLCLPSVSRTIFDITVNNEIDEINNTWNDNSQDITLVYPNIEYDGTGQDLNLDNALCFAIRSYVDLVCEATISAMSDGNIITDGITWSLNAVADIADFVGGLIPAGNILSWEISQIIDLIIGAIGSSDISAFQDETAREEVSCCIWNNLRNAGSGNSVQVSDWLSSMTGCTITGNAESIANVVSATLSSDNAYLTLMQLWSQTVTLVTSGLVIDCPCEAIDCYEWDFTIDDRGWTVWTTGDRPYGTYVSGVGWQCVHNTLLGVTGNRVYIENINWGSTSLIHSILFYCIPTNAGSNRGGGTQVMNGTAIVNDDSLPSLVYDGSPQFVQTNQESNGDGVRVYWSMESGTPDADALTITKIRIYYTGGSPIDGGEC